MEGREDAGAQGVSPTFGKAGVGMGRARWEEGHTESRAEALKREIWGSL